MKAGLHIVSGVFLVLATSLLTGSVVGERHIRRITAADLPAPSNSTGPARASGNSNNSVLKSVTNCSTGGSDGGCGEALAEEAKDKLPELSSDDPHGVVEPSVDEALQERLHSGVLLHLTTAEPDHHHQSSHAQDSGSTPRQEPTTPAKESHSSPYKYRDVSAEVGGFDSPLTTPRVSLVDDRFLRVSESIRQNLEDLEEQHAFRPTSTPSSHKLETTPTSAYGYIPPTAGDITPPDGSKVALEYTNHVSILYNDTHDPPRLVHRDVVVENGTHVEFSSSFIHTEHFDDSPTTTETPVAEAASGAGSDNQESDHSSETHSNSKDNAVEEANLSEDVVKKQRISNVSSEYLKSSAVNNSSFDYIKDIHNNTVPPGEIHSTTSSRTPSRSQLPPEGTAAPPNSLETTTTDSKLSRKRYTTKRLQISGVPSTTPAATTELPTASTQRSRGRSPVRRPSNSTTSEPESSTLPPPAPTNRTRARMISSSKSQGNATNSVEEMPTVAPAANNGQPPRKKQTTRYSWRRPTTSEEDDTEMPMVRIQISTVQPTTSSKSVIKDGAVGNGTDRKEMAFTTQPSRYLRRRQNTTTVPGDAATPKRTVQKPAEISSNEVVVRNSSKPIRNRGSVKFAGLSTLAADQQDSLIIPPTAAAWALATLRGPAELGGARVERRPSTNDTDAEGASTVSPEVGAESTTEVQRSMEAEGANTSSPAGVANSRSAGTTTSGPVDDLLTLGFITTQRAFEEVGTSARSDLLLVTGEPVLSSASTPVPDSIQDSRMVTEEEEEESVSTTTELFSTTVEDGTVGVTSMDTTTVSASSEMPTSTAPPTTTDRPVFSTDGPDGVTEVISTTEGSNPQASPVQDSTTSRPDSVTEVPIGTTSHEPGTTTIMAEVEDLEDTTLPPTTTGQPHVVILGEGELPEEGHQGEEHHSGHEDPDYVVEMDPSPTVEPRQQVPSTSRTTTLPASGSDDDKTTTEMPTTAQPSTTEVPDSTTISWTPSFEGVSSYLRVTVHSTWDQLCGQRINFKQALARLMADKMDRKLSARNVVLANVGPSQCGGVVSAGDEEPQLIDVNVFILNEEGVFSKELSDMFYVLVANMNFPSPLEIKRVELQHGALPIASETNNAGVIAAISISCIGAICLLLLAVLLIIMRKRQKRFNYGQRCTPVSLDAYSLDSVSVYDSVRRKGGLRASKRSYGNPGFDDPGAPSHPMNFAGLANFSSDRAALEEEFGMVPQVAPKSDELPEGAETKNRYSNVIPLPETRVPLSPIEGEVLSDYINANYVRGPKNEQKFYIACQAPLQSTVTDFWRMVWEQQSKVIIMLTDLVENGVEKCADYLPPSEVLDCHRLFGDFQITLKKREEREKYVISTLQLKNLETNLWREVTHLWHLSWPHQGVPEESSSIIAFLIEARPFMKANTGPNIVHCSPGTGRTGTVLACDICIREFEQSRMVDIPRCVYRLRRDRAGAVKTRDQYVYIYQVLNTYATKLTGGGGLDSI